MRACLPTPGLHCQIVSPMMSVHRKRLLPAIPDRTFAEIEPVRDGIEPRIGSDDPCQAGCREIGVQQFPPVTDG